MDYNDSQHSSDLSLPRPVDGNKRRLLLIYIHGFMGSEASFHRFPEHIHELLSAMLDASHVVYTRIYPRYKSHGEVQTAVNQFSAWLSPHEADDLDVILLGHSLGGILAADVALLQAPGQMKRKHRILGLVNFDVPFLGLHPRVIPTGIMSSMPKADPATQEELTSDRLSVDLSNKPTTLSSNFDPPFVNDVHLAQRSFFKSMMHFVNKNTDNLSRSILDRVVSSVKFANVVNNYPELRQRHRRLIELEEAEYSLERVRFINFYTASTGRIPKPTTKPINNPLDQNKDQAQDVAATLILQDHSETLSTSKSAEDAVAAGDKGSKEQDLELNLSSLSLAAEGTDSEKDKSPVEVLTIVSPTVIEEDEPPVTTPIPVHDTNSDLVNQKLRKFILLPTHHWRHSGNAHWTPILMEDMDEVTAHQSMFVPHGANYDRLVGDTIAVIEQWIQDELSQRLLQEALD